MLVLPIGTIQQQAGIHDMHVVPERALWLWRVENCRLHGLVSARPLLKQSWADSPARVQEMPEGSDVGRQTPDLLPLRVMRDEQRSQIVI